MLQVFPIGDFDVTVSGVGTGRAVHPAAGAAVSVGERREAGRGDRGDSGPLEVVILVPVVLLLFALVVAYGRTTQADTKVEHAAAVGARAAAAAQTAGWRAGPGRGRRHARAWPRPDWAAAPSVSVGGDYRPGGRVTVTVSCVASLGDLTGLGLPLGSRTLTATASEVIDVRRGAVDRERATGAGAACRCSS